MAKAVFNKKIIFVKILDLYLRQKLIKCYILSTAMYGAKIYNTLGSRSEIRKNFLNVELVKDAEDQLDRSCET